MKHGPLLFLLLLTTVNHNFCGGFSTDTATADLSSSTDEAEEELLSLHDELVDENAATATMSNSNTVVDMMEEESLPEQREVAAAEHDETTTAATPVEESESEQEQIQEEEEEEQQQQIQQEEPVKETENHNSYGNNEAMETDRNGSSVNSATTSSNNKQQQRLWGAAAPTTNTPENLAEGTEPASSQQQQQQHATPNFSFAKRTKPEIEPPVGFTITARVFIDPADKLAHLDMENAVTLPYFDCGVTGSTTAPLPVRDAAFRHSLTPTTPWTGTDGKHPLLAIALSPLIIETNSGESQEIQAGQAILLEDVLIDGHKLLPMPNQELQVLFLTLPQTHYHPGKDRLSLQKLAQKHPSNPCILPEARSSSSILSSSSSSTITTRTTALLTIRNIRRSLLGLLGLSLSALLADFFSKTAPLWLAVGVGGTCFVAAGTALVVLGGETLVSSLEYHLEQRRLAAAPRSTTVKNKNNSNLQEEDTIPKAEAA